VTYSIVGADTHTRLVGGAGTSCLMGDDVYVIYAAAPGHGVVHAQAYYNLNGRTRAVELLAEGRAPTDILASITAPSFDRRAEIRQYGIVDVSGRSAGYTGSGTTVFAGDLQGNVDGLAYSVQGNILTSEKVLSHAARAFEQSGCDLPERLMTALEAGAQGGEGDSRCSPQGIPSDSAFLQVESADGSQAPYVSLRVTTSGTQDPLPLLRARLSAWRVEHPCPVSPSASATQQSGCSCKQACSEGGLGATAALLCSLLVVAWRRQRSPRKLRPIQTP